MIPANAGNHKPKPNWVNRPGRCIKCIETHTPQNTCRHMHTHTPTNQGNKSSLSCYKNRKSEVSLSIVEEAGGAWGYLASQSNLIVNFQTMGNFSR